MDDMKRAIPLQEEIKPGRFTLFYRASLPELIILL
jgi:hypothetical protein